VSTQTLSIRAQLKTIANRSLAAKVNVIMLIVGGIQKEDTNAGSKNNVELRQTMFKTTERSWIAASVGNLTPSPIDLCTRESVKP